MTGRAADAGAAVGIVKRSVMDRIIDTIEAIAAMFVGMVAADIFISVLLRRFFSLQIPDAYDFGRMLLGILIFWGIAATSYRGGHITVDLVWAAAGPRWKRAIDVFATLVLLFVVTVQTYTLFDKVRVDLQRPRADLRSRPADLAVLRRRLDRRRVGRGADRHPHLPADLPSRRHPRRKSATSGDDERRRRRHRWASSPCSR